MVGFHEQGWTGFNGFICKKLHSSQGQILFSTYDDIFSMRENARRRKGRLEMSGNAVTFPSLLCLPQGHPGPLLSSRTPIQAHGMSITGTARRLPCRRKTGKERMVQ
jgi:hypothetical protein